MRNYYSVKCSLFILLNIIILQCNSKHINAFVPFGMTKNSFTLEIGLLLFHPFTEKLMCFHINAELAASQVLHQ
jgi:hypothetical protein